MDNNNESGSRIINLDYLTQLSKGNKSFVKEMIGIFLSENPEEIKFLEGKIAERDYEVIRATAHKLKSTFPFVGLDKILENDVEELESLAAAKGDAGEIEKRFLKIKQVCEEVCRELPAYLDANLSV
ncbi:MAG: Hpt domain-containing protein [Bacteroidia bacterium]